MFKKLQAKWKVNGVQLFLIILTFALGGSLCGYAGRKILGLLSIDQRWIWLLLYIILITLLWPVCVLLISIPLGQFAFFRKYIRKVGKRMGLGSKQSAVSGQQSAVGGQRSAVKVAIFASGGGSNAEKIIKAQYDEGAGYSVDVIVCNKPGAGVLNIAAANGIDTILITKDDFNRPAELISELKERNTGFIVLAGFLWKLPAALIQAFPGRIVNIHPALLPKFGGKGMYGHHVHEAVIASGENESGISIHFVDELYDHGNIIFQATCSIQPTDTPDSLADKIHQLEHEHYPRVVRETIGRL